MQGEKRTGYKSVRNVNNYVCVHVGMQSGNIYQNGDVRIPEPMEIATRFPVYV